MNPPPTDLVRSREPSLAGPGPLAAQWAALQEAGAAVAALAGLAAERPSAQVCDFPAGVAAAGGWRLELASAGVADLAAIMRPGLQALLAVSDRGQDPTAAALALWREYHHARAALLALVPAQE